MYTYVEIHRILFRGTIAYTFVTIIESYVKFDLFINIEKKNNNNFRILMVKINLGAPHPP